MYLQLGCIWTIGSREACQLPGRRRHTGAIALDIHIRHTLSYKQEFVRLAICLPVVPHVRKLHMSDGPSPTKLEPLPLLARRSVADCALGGSPVEFCVLCSLLCFNSQVLLRGPRLDKVLALALSSVSLVAPLSLSACGASAEP